jgi:NAD+ synthase
MNNFVPKINSEKETKKIVSFITKTFGGQNIKNGVIGVSGGIDSAVSLLLLSKAVPPQNIHAINMPYRKDYQLEDFEEVVKTAKIPKKNVEVVEIKNIVDVAAKTYGINPSEDKIRFGNISARVRMITLFDFAKHKKAMVVGTENKSEELLSYFTRFGDQASDIEPIQHLYKTQIYALAEYLNVPKGIIKKQPTAGLWPGQTDEKELGFSYEEADNVLYLYFEKKMKLKDILNSGFKNAEKVIKRVEENGYKHKTPYKI